MAKEEKETTIDMSDLIGSYNTKDVKNVLKEMKKRLELAKKNPIGHKVTKDGLETK